MQNRMVINSQENHVFINENTQKVKRLLWVLFKYIDYPQG